MYRPPHEHVLLLFSSLLLLSTYKERKKEKTAPENRYINRYMSRYTATSNVTPAPDTPAKPAPGPSKNQPKGSRWDSGDKPASTREK
jgi:hypothetical protein